MLFERKSGAPTPVKITTAANTYTFTGSAQVNVTNFSDIETLRSSPYIQVVSGQSFPAPVTPNIVDAVLVNGVLTNASTGIPIINSGVGTDFRQWGSAVPNTDASAVLQAAINDRYANHDSTPILIPTLPTVNDYWQFNVTLRPNIQILGGGWQSRVTPNPGSTTPVFGSVKQTGAVTTNAGWAALDPTRCQIRNLAMYGNSASGASGRAIELLTSNNDFRFDTWNIPNAPGDDWFDPAHILSDLLILDFKADWAVVVGTNMKGTWLDRCFIKSCYQGGLLVDCTDSQFTNSQLGGCGSGVTVRNYNNMLSNVKSWYHFGTQNLGGTQYTGDGNGFTLTYATGGKAIGGGSLTQMTGCQTQDNYGYGLQLHGVEACQVDSHVAGGDTNAGVLVSGPARENTVKFKTMKADRVQTNGLVVIDGTAASGNDFEMTDSTSPSQIQSRGAQFSPVKSTNGGAVFTRGNSFSWSQGDRSRFDQTNGAATITPDCKYRYHTIFASSGGLTTIAEPINPLPGARLTITYTQGAAGTGTIAWHSSFTASGPNPGQPTTGNLAYTTYDFINASDDPSVRYWRLIGKT